MPGGNDIGKALLAVVLALVFIGTGSVGGCFVGLVVGTSIPGGDAALPAVLLGSTAGAIAGLIGAIFLIRRIRRKLP